MDWFTDGLGDMFSDAIDKTMKAIWEAGLYLLRFVFGMIDELSAFDLSVDANGNPTSPAVSAVWGDLRNVALVIALGLFFWQLTSSVLRGGRGFWRASTGPVAFGLALGMTTALVAALLAAADYLAVQLLQKGLDSGSFSAAFDQSVGHEKFVQGVNGVVLGIVAIIGVIPAGIGYLLEMIFRQGAILVLVATVPITAAGLTAQTTASWFWRSLRWIIAAIMMKPALALTLVVGVRMLEHPEGIFGLLVGIGVLLIALTCPFVLFKFFAFVDPSSEAGGALRSWFQQNVADAGYSSAGGGGAGGSGGGGAMEATNSARFDQAVASYATATANDAGVGYPSPSYGDGGGDDQSNSNSSSRSSDDAPGDSGSGTSGGGAGGGPTDASAPPPQGGPGGDAGGSGGGPGGGGGHGDPSPPEHPHDGGDGRGGGGGKGAGGRGGAAAGGAEEAAVVL